jgi:hypothetical protein
MSNGVLTVTGLCEQHRPRPTRTDVKQGADGAGDTYHDRIASCLGRGRQWENGHPVRGTSNCIKRAGRGTGLGGERFLVRLAHRCDGMRNWSYNCRHEHAHSPPQQIRAGRIGR